VFLGNLQEIETKKKMEENDYKVVKRFQFYNQIRSLPELAKVYLTRLLYVDTPIPEDLIKSWYKPEFK